LSQKHTWPLRLQTGLLLPYQTSENDFGWCSALLNVKYLLQNQRSITKRDEKLKILGSVLMIESNAQEKPLNNPKQVPKSDSENCFRHYEGRPRDHGRNHGIFPP
jgi:hypothetical protein